jgi:hypothetical protein
MQAAAISQIDSDDDLEFEDSSDDEPQEPAHEWQSVDRTEKRERSQGQNFTTNKTNAHKHKQQI